VVALLFLRILCVLALRQVHTMHWCVAELRAQCCLQGPCCQLWPAQAMSQLLMSECLLLCSMPVLHSRRRVPAIWCRLVQTCTQAACVWARKGLLCDGQFVP
jgi:hypothetical protein